MLSTYLFVCWWALFIYYTVMYYLILAILFKWWNKWSDIKFMYNFGRRYTHIVNNNMFHKYTVISIKTLNTMAWSIHSNILWTNIHEHYKGESSLPKAFSEHFRVQGGHLHYFKLLKGDRSTPLWISLYRPQ